MARPFFQRLLETNPPSLLPPGFYKTEQYWRYRFRLMALLGLARMGEKSAYQELVNMHKKGGPTERMDVVLAFRELGQVPAFAFEDLGSTEPKLVATAAILVSEHGESEERRRLKQLIESRPLWKEFINSGIDDHNILKYSGIRPEGERWR